MDTNQTTEQKDPNAELRAHADRVEAENKALRTRVLHEDIRGIGLDPSTGLGKAVAQGYSGDFTEGSVATYAKEEYGHEHKEEEPTQGEPEQLQQVEAQQAEVDKITQQGESAPTGGDDRVAAAEAALRGDPAKVGSGDARKSLAAKLERFASQQ